MFPHLFISFPFEVDPPRSQIHDRLFFPVVNYKAGRRRLNSLFYKKQRYSHETSIFNNCSMIREQIDGFFT
jgi:hypothetical protein